MTTRLLIDCGADVNSVNIDGDTPMHILVKNLLTTNLFKIIDLLCDAGAHLDYVNKERKSPLESIAAYRVKLIERLKQKMNVVPLKCLCAQRIRREQIVYENLLSNSLVNFLQKH